MREFLTAFSKLAPTQREALLLAVVEGQPYDVIAAHTGVSVGTVKSRISRARDRLEHLLMDGDSELRSADISEADIAEEDAATAADPHSAAP
jgi:RNA polymerase sigma-70 factor (ECF subfamily)